jgi:diguanylate cyclase (GGDEF)-like protein
VYSQESLVLIWKKQLLRPADKSRSAASDSNALLSTVMESYRSALTAMGASGARACPAVGAELKKKLTNLAAALSPSLTSASVEETEKNVEEELRHWGVCTAQYFRSKANDAKELMILLADTAKSVGERDQRYATRFTELTTRLQTIADLEDLTQVRRSLTQGALELKTYVDEMAQDSRDMVAKLRAEVTSYETKVKEVEQLALRDALTGLSNRRYVEERIAWRISYQQMFSLAMLDLNGFKQINDRYGHNAGDDVLKQFSQELRSHSRSTDIVGRWGGDEFILVLDCDLNGAKLQIERLRKWAYGEYKISCGNGNDESKVLISASVGVAQWQQGESAQEVIDRSDAAMYEHKELSRMQMQ